jgi:hypothetical protein
MAEQSNKGTAHGQLGDLLRLLFPSFPNRMAARRGLVGTASSKPEVAALCAVDRDSSQAVNQRGGSAALTKGTSADDIGRNSFQPPHVLVFGHSQLGDQDVDRDHRFEQVICVQSRLHSIRSSVRHRHSGSRGPAVQSHQSNPKRHPRVGDGTWKSIRLDKENEIPGSWCQGGAHKTSARKPCRTQMRQLKPHRERASSDRNRRAWLRRWNGTGSSLALSPSFFFFSPAQQTWGLSFAASTRNFGAPLHHRRPRQFIRCSQRHAAHPHDAPDLQWDPRSGVARCPTPWNCRRVPLDDRLAQGFV